MKRSELKQSLKLAVLQSTPDLLPTLLPGYSAEEALCGINQPAEPRKRPRFQIACVMAAVCIMFLGVFHLVQPEVDSIVSIDVNPSIELTIDQNDRVIKSKASNDDAAAILKNMKLRDKDLQEATGTIIHEMLETGYLSANSTDNAILISVASRNEQKTGHLQDKITDSIDAVLTQNNASAKVLRQADTLSDDLQDFARQNSVSVGKADLVRKLMEKDSSLEAAALCKMPLKELNSLIETKSLEINGLVIKEEGGKSTSSELPPVDPSSSSNQSVSKPDNNSLPATEGSATESSRKPGWSSSRPRPSSSQPSSSGHFGNSSSEGTESEEPIDIPPDIEDPDGVPDYPFDDPDDVSSGSVSSGSPAPASSSSGASPSSSSSAVSEKPVSSKPSSSSAASSGSSSQKATSGSSDKSEASSQKSASSRDKS